MGRAGRKKGIKRASSSLLLLSQPAHLSHQNINQPACLPIERHSHPPFQYPEAYPPFPRDYLPKKVQYAPLTLPRCSYPPLLTLLPAAPNIPTYHPILSKKKERKKERKKESARQNAFPHPQTRQVLHLQQHQIHQICQHLPPLPLPDLLRPQFRLRLLRPPRPPSLPRARFQNLAALRRQRRQFQFRPAPGPEGLPAGLHRSDPRVLLASV